MRPQVDLLVDLDSDGWIELTASGEELFDVSLHSGTQSSFVLSSDLDEPVEFAVANDLIVPRFLLSKGGDVRGERRHGDKWKGGGGVFWVLSIKWQRCCLPGVPTVVMVVHIISRMKEELETHSIHVVTLQRTAVPVNGFFVSCRLRSEDCVSRRLS